MNVPKKNSFYVIIFFDNSKKIFRTNKWPTIDVTRKSVEETAASVLKIHDIFNQK